MSLELVDELLEYEEEVDYTFGDMIKEILNLK